MAQIVFGDSAVGNANPDFSCMCLARLEWSCAGEGGDEAGRTQAQVAASEVRICQVRAPFWVLLNQRRTDNDEWVQERLQGLDSPWK